MPKSPDKDEIRVHALPKKIVVHIPTSGDPNLSLQYYKWANIYKEGHQKTIADKGVFFKLFMALSKNAAYQAAFKMRQRYLDKLAGAEFTLTTTCRLVFGTGYDHPTEIGFMFDWTTGLPIIPGSVLKGVARAAAEDANLPPDKITRIFGTKTKPGEKESQSGCIIFLPAYPVLTEGAAFLDVDVMTPHYKEYYDNPDANPPADYYSPVPLKFLTVPEGVKYQFRLLDREKRDMTKEKLKVTELNHPLKQAEDILKIALQEQGVGAKTNVFYGYFK